MMTFRNRRLSQLHYPHEHGVASKRRGQAKGKQDLYTRQSPQVLKALRAFFRWADLDPWLRPRE